MTQTIIFSVVDSRVSDIVQIRATSANQACCSARFTCRFERVPFQRTLFGVLFLLFFYLLECILYFYVFQNWKKLFVCCSHGHMCGTDCNMNYKIWKKNHSLSVCARPLGACGEIGPVPFGANVLCNILLFHTGHNKVRFVCLRLPTNGILWGILFRQRFKSYSVLIVRNSA